MAVTSDFRPEVEVQPFRACTMKNMQYLFMAKSPKLSRRIENWGRETRW